MKFLFSQISVVSDALSIQNSSVLPDTYNMTPFLDANDSYVLKPDKVFPSISKEENFVTEHSSGKQKVKRNAKSLGKVFGNQHCDDDFMEDLIVAIYDKISAIKNIKSSLKKIEGLKKFYFDKYFKDVQDSIKYGRIQKSDDPLSYKKSNFLLSIFFEFLVMETHRLLFSVVDLSNKVEEKDKNILKEELLNSLDVKFKDEESLKTTQWFDEEKLFKFLDTLDNLTLYHLKNNGVCETTKHSSEFKSKINSQDKKKNLTSTSESIFNRKLYFNTSTTEMATESPTTEKILKKKKLLFILGFRPFGFSMFYSNPFKKSRPNEYRSKDHTSKNNVWDSVIICVWLFIAICLIACFCIVKKILIGTS